MRTLPLSDNEARCLRDYIIFSTRFMEETVKKDTECLEEMMQKPYLEDTAKEFSSYVERETDAVAAAKEIMKDL